MTYLIDREGRVLDDWYGYEKGRTERILSDPDLQKKLLTAPSR